jgi:hypothetical protein
LKSGSPPRALKDDDLEKPLERSSGAHHPWLSAADEVKDENRDVRDVGESRGDVLDCADDLTPPKNEPPNGDMSEG